MKLREHPGISNWPPSWLATSGSHDGKGPDPSATLRNVALSRVDPVTICYITVQDRDESYMGTVTFKDSVLCQCIYGLLNARIGSSLKDIEDLELP